MNDDTQHLLSAPLTAPANSVKTVSRLDNRVWLLLLSFVLHDGEEVLTMAAWIKNNAGVLQQVAALGHPGSLIIRNLPSSKAEVAGAVVFEAIIIGLATWLLLYRQGKGSGLFLYSTILGGFFLHVVTHLLQAIWFGGYTPGVVTALLLIPPASVYLYGHLFKATSLSCTTALRNAVFGGLLLLPVVLLAHYVGRMVF